MGYLIWITLKFPNTLASRIFERLWYVRYEGGKGFWLTTKEPNRQVRGSCMHTAGLLYGAFATALVVMRDVPGGSSSVRPCRRSRPWRGWRRRCGTWSRPCGSSAPTRAAPRHCTCRRTRRIPPSLQKPTRTQMIKVVLAWIPKTEELKISFWERHCLSHLPSFYDIKKLNDLGVKSTHKIPFWVEVLMACQAPGDNGHGNKRKKTCWEDRISKLSMPT